MIIENHSIHTVNLQVGGIWALIFVDIARRIHIGRSRSNLIYLNLEIS
jgi:hypothetical protein